MKYKSIIELLRLCETSWIKVLPLPGSCEPEQIPDVFGLLLPDVVTILEQNSDQFCQSGEIMALFGMQPCGGLLTSKFPKQTQRIIHQQIPDYHLCCTLDFLVLQPEQLSQVNSWQHFSSVIIDFTRGVIMNPDQYLHELFTYIPEGKVYGYLDPKKMAYVWEVVKHADYRFVSGKV